MGKFKKLTVLSLAAISFIVASQSAFATKVTVQKSGVVVIDRSNNGSGSSKKQPVMVSCPYGCAGVIVK